MSQRLANFTWRATSWLVAGLLSVAVPLLIATWVVPSAVTVAAPLASSSVGLGVMAVAALVLVGFACWAGVVAVRAIWRKRQMLLASVIVTSGLKEEKQK